MITTGKVTPDVPEYERPGVPAIPSPPHDVAALANGGPLTLRYAITLVRSGGTEEYVGNALRAHGVPAGKIPALVFAAFNAREERSMARLMFYTFGGLVLVAAGMAVLAGFVAMHR